MLLAPIVVLLFAAIGSIRYRLTDDAIEVEVLGRRVRRFQLDDIEQVSRRGAFIHESWSGPRFWNAVTLRRRRGFFRHVIITPDEPDRFMEEIERRLTARVAGTGTVGRSQP